MEKRKQKLLEWIIIVGIAVLASVPLMMKGIHRGHDIGFHLMRIEGISEELKRLQIPVRMQSLWLGGYGYPVSIYYGDTLLYIPALFRLFKIPVVTAYKAYIFLINILTTASAFFCFKRIWNSRKIALLATLAYTTAGYRMVDIYVRAAVGEYSSMVFFPLIALSVYRIYMSNGESKNELFKNAFLLCFGMSGLMCTHFLSSEMTVFVLILVGIILWKKTFQRKTILQYLLAIIGFFLLNLYFIVPFLDYYCNVQVNINAASSVGQANQIQFEGAYLVQYLSFFQNIFGVSSINIKERMQLTPGILLMAVLLCGIILCRKSKKILLYTVFSLIMLFLASNIFPWDYLAEIPILGNLMTQVQFPWRYLAFAVLFLTLLFGEILKETILAYPYKLYGWFFVIIGVCLFMTYCFNSNYKKDTDKISFNEKEELNTYEVEGKEYLLCGTDLNSLSNEITGNFIESGFVSRNGTHMELFVITGKEGGCVELPVFAYKGYCVEDESGKSYKISIGTNNRLRFELPAAYAGTVYLDFHAPWYWHAAEIISAVCAVSFFAVYYFLVKKCIPISFFHL